MVPTSLSKLLLLYWHVRSKDYGLIVQKTSQISTLCCRQKTLQYKERLMASSIDHFPRYRSNCPLRQSFPRLFHIFQRNCCLSFLMPRPWNCSTTPSILRSLSGSMCGDTFLAGKWCLITFRQRLTSSEKHTFQTSKLKDILNTF